MTGHAGAGSDASSARPAASSATARSASWVRPPLSRHEADHGPQPGRSADEAPVITGAGHTPEVPPGSGGKEELTVDIELVEIVEREPPSRASAVRRPPLSLSDYLTRRAR